MKKLKHLYIGLFGFSLSLCAMDFIIELDTTLPVDYSIAQQQCFLSEKSIQKCIDVLVSDDKHSALLELLDSQEMNLYGEMVKAALINEYQVILSEQFKDELRVTELDYYKKREPKEELSELDCIREGVVAGVLTSNDGIVFLSFRKEGQEYVTYLDYWFLNDLLNDEIEEKKPRSQSKVPVRYTPIGEGNFPTTWMLSEPFTNRFLVGISEDCECQLWCLKEKECGYELTIEHYPEGSSQIGVSPDGSKLCVYSYPPVPYKLDQFFQAIYFFLRIDRLSSLKNSGNIYENENRDQFLCYSSSAWCLKSGIIARWDSSMIEFRNADAISQIRACFRSGATTFEALSSLRISANGRYLLASSQRKIWLIDTVSKRVEEIASNDFDEGNSLRQPDEGLNRSTLLKVHEHDRLEMSADERFAVLNWRDKNPILYDLKRKAGVEINIGGKETLLMQDPAVFSEAETRSTYLTSKNDMILIRLGRRIKVVDLRSALKSKSLKELVGQIKKRNAIAINSEQVGSLSTLK